MDAIYTQSVFYNYFVSTSESFRAATIQIYESSYQKYGCMSTRLRLKVIAWCVDETMVTFHL